MPKSAHSFLGYAFFCYHDSKKAMLARDIALVHDRPTYKISELINRNRKRFKDGIDIIDLKTSMNFAITLSDSVFTQPILFWSF